ncbi:MAG TPA: ketoacyl-ACP synthase III [Thermoanaerobaculia bacterium]|nr:ketoacyl-ACP synthase III [Thermoanaerobaculia bacterium]
MMKTAAIRAVASHLPETVLSNDALAAMFGDWDADKIYEKTGIRERRIAAPDECASDLGVAAAQKLFERGACAPADIDFLLFCTQSADHVLPTTACLVQDRLGLRTDCGALDINQGCSGFVYGLSLAKGLIASGAAKNVLLITADTYTKYINERDRSVRTIFGDGAAATLISAIDADAEHVGPFVFGTDGRGAQNLIVPAGGTRLRVSDETRVESCDTSGNWRHAENLYMNGGEIFTFTLTAVPKAVNALLAQAGRTVEDVDHFVFHQANRFMLERIRGKMKLPEEKFWIDVETIGNTVSSTIPIALETGMAQGKMQAGQTALLAGFGVGYSWAAAMVRLA